ncbi:hypothetical protein [Planktothricoides raciborskii]|uniref:Uncharacterized protein n=2 Tax=Planktothricoides raciborskii TaxID=132608 RepID=A0AAU8JBN0_9CYAN|nr:hypothetical protein [Planktothricoides raciborskii]MBD2544850.1 hypothetical protein [Planktothricoides raciborskii FACHB-1370]MBD2583054.1 hypothetical protein [Planktothricoides raciborskii FACHB-1261]
MSLPFILDVAIGLIFIYLILSLLASEIQGLLSTLLQWRAEHVKQSIEVLLSGSQETTKASETRAIADTLYSHPLIRNLNQEAKSGWAKAVRQFSNLLITKMQTMTKSSNVFGKDIITQEERKSGPSYIPPETFATSIMETLKIPELNRMLIVKKVEEFEKKILDEIIKENLLNYSRLSEQNKQLVETELENLWQEWNHAIDDLKAEKLSLQMCIYRFATKIGSFAEECQERLSLQEPGVHEFIGQLSKLRKDYFGSDIRRQLLMTELKPKMTDVIAEVRQGGEMYAKIQEYIGDQNSPAYKTVHAVYSNLPDSVKESLTSLAKKIDEKGSQTENELRQLEKEIEQWFDRSMQRASGVYKRNSKGVAILIGFLVAVGANADTLYMVNSLSSNSVLRSTISLSAERLVENSFPTTMTSPPEDKFDQVKNEVRDALEDVSLPVGWNQYNLAGQAKQELSFGPVKLPFIHRVIGWLISGIAISMGSSFWFDLLGKVIDLKNMGGKKSSDSR